MRDIEIDGYQERFARTLTETNPNLPALDTYQLARDRAELEKAEPNMAPSPRGGVLDDALDHRALGERRANAAEALATFRAARQRTIDCVAGLDTTQLERRALFEGYGWVTVRGLIHYLCSHDQQHLAGLQWLLGKMEAP